MSTPTQSLQVKLLDPRFGDLWPLPAHATESSAGMDLRAALEAPMTQPGDAALIPSGIAIHLADPQLCAVILPRSGWAIATASCSATVPASSMRITRGRC